jgi:hypothetical protein
MPMFKRFFITAILIPGFTFCFSQLPEDFPSVDKNDLPGAELSTSRFFSGTSLFGYMNGGAELYLEYGFSAASVTEIRYMGGSYKTEIYKMTGPEEAFGIFSVSKYRCRGMPPLAKYTCQTRYQLQICKGPYYISIINGTGTLSDSIASISIGSVIAAKISDDDADLSAYLPDIPEEKIQTGCFLARGRLGIVNGSPDLEDFFQGLSDYTAVIVNLEEKRIISVRFSNNETYEKFLHLHDHEFNDLSSSGNVKKIGELHLLIEMPE